MQMHNDFIIISKDSTIDEKDNVMSIFKIIDTFNFELEDEQYQQFETEKAKSIALLPASYIINSSWSVDEKLKKDLPIEVSIEITDPKGKTLGGSKDKAVFPSGNDKLRLNGATNVLPVTGNGKYTMVMTILDSVSGDKLADSTIKYNVNVKSLKP